MEPPLKLRHDPRVRVAAQVVGWAMWRPVPVNHKVPRCFYPIYCKGAKTDLVTETGLSKSSVYRAVDNLLASHWVAQIEEPPPWAPETLVRVFELRYELPAANTGGPALAIAGEWRCSPEEHRYLEAMLKALADARRTVGMPEVSYTVGKTSCAPALDMLRLGKCTPSELVAAVRACVWHDSQAAGHRAKGVYATPTRPFEEQNWARTKAYIAVLQWQERAPEEESKGLL